MTTAANPSQRRADIPRRRRIQRTASQLEALGDVKLIELCCEWDEEAWREFRRRYEPALRDHCYIVAVHAGGQLASDAVDDMIGDIYLRILQRDMHRLRYWLAGNRQASALTWLRMIAGGIAVDHVRALERDANAQATYAELQRDAHCGLRRAAGWEAAQDLALAVPEKKRRAKRRHRVGAAARALVESGRTLVTPVRSLVDEAFANGSAIAESMRAVAERSTASRSKSITHRP